MTASRPLSIAALVLGLVLSPTVARAQLQFWGHGLTGAGLARSLGWSSDLGPSLTLTTPIPSLCNDSLFAQYVERNNASGYGYVRDSLWIAPPGSYGTAAPWARVKATNSVNSGGIYGMNSDFYHQVNLRFPPGASGSAYFALRWRVATSKGSGGSTFPYVQVNGVMYGGLNASGGGTVFFQVPLSGGEVAVNVNSHALSQGEGLVVSSVEAEVFGDLEPLAGAPLTPLPEAIGMSIAPNPTRGEAQVSFRLAEAGPAHVRLYDLGGRAVRSLHRGPLPAGAHTLAWDGRDDAGNAVPAGIYWARVESRLGASQKRLVVTR